MEILDLRHLRSRDLDSLLEEEKTLWQRELQWDYGSSTALIKRYVDARALPGYVAVEGGRAIGYCFYVYENAKGLIGDVFASDTPCAGDAESVLLTHVIETLQATPGIRRIEAQLMTLRHRPAGDFFEKQNLQRFQRRFMILPLQDAQLRYSSSRPVAGNGSSGPNRDAGGATRVQAAPEIRLEAWDGRRVSEAAQLITHAYRGHEDSAISDQYRSLAGAVRFLDNIIHYPGCGDFDPENSFLAFRNDTSQLCGMGLSSLVGDRVSHITQLCVDPELQGTGVGRALISHIVEKLRQRRFTAVTLTVTSSNTRAIRLYEKLHFYTLKEFNAFAWDAPVRSGRA